MSYLMVLPVRRRIHWGMGRFCFCAFASFCFVLKVLWLCEGGGLPIVSFVFCINFAVAP